MLSTLIRLATGSILLVALVGCPAPTGTAAGSVLSVTIDGGDQSIAVGSTLTLTATVATTGNASDSVTWNSNSTTLATIDPNGTITGLTTGNTIITATSTADPTKNDAIILTVDPPGTLSWTRQFGTGTFDSAYGIATDASGNVYTVGSTFGAFEGSNLGFEDAFIRAYDSDGNLGWTRQFGTTSNDRATGVATDADGNLYATGYTAGALEGSNLGGHDAFIRAYDKDGVLRWTRQFGTASDDFALGITTDTNGNLYTTGHTYGALAGSNLGSRDAFIRAYDSNGVLRWTRQFGTSSDDFAFGITTDANGDVYSTGSTAGALEGSNAGDHDAFIRSYDRDGNFRWVRQFGTSSTDLASGIATDTFGNVFTTGATAGALEGSNAGFSDAFIRAYDSNGNLRWTRQFGTTGVDDANGITTNASGHVFTTGSTEAVLETVTFGGTDAFIRSYDGNGNLRWTRQFGTSSTDSARGIATIGIGNVHATGTTGGSLEGSNAGGTDAFIRAYGP